MGVPNFGLGNEGDCICNTVMRMDDEEFRKCYKTMVEWEPLPAEKAEEILTGILAVLFQPGDERKGAG